MTLTCANENKVTNDFNKLILDYFENYSKNNQPIEVSFRDLVPQISNSDRANHLIHAYPAKLLMHIPYFFLNNNIFSKPGDYVLDPFCGSGTVLLESIINNRNAYGTDANPLARLISEVKIKEYDIEILKGIAKNIKLDINDASQFKAPKVINIDYWFLPQIKQQLSSILEAIEKIPNEDYKKFFLICFSNCIKKVSLSDPRVSVPVKLKIAQYYIDHPLRKKTEEQLKQLHTIKVKDKFFEIVLNNIKRTEALIHIKSQDASASIIGNDAKSLNLDENTIDLIITSPPYAGAQKYIRSSSLNLGWLGLTSTDKCLKNLEEQNIGREHYKKSDYSLLKKTNILEADLILEDIYNINPLRSFIAANYLNEMRIAFSESIRVLKKGSYFILVAANNQICGKEFKTQEYLMKIMQELGMKVVLRLIDDIKSYGLMTKRNKTASIITREWILIFQK